MINQKEPKKIPLTDAPRPDEPDRRPLEPLKKTSGDKDQT